MKAALCLKHGSPEGLEIKEVGKPPVKEDDILIHVAAATVSAGDVVLRKQSFLRFLLFWPLARWFFGVKNQRKKILGHEFSGWVESVGDKVSKFKKGDAVFGTTGFKGGAHAEYLSCPESSIIASKPDHLSFAQAAALPIGGICAWDLLSRAEVQPGDKVLIYGASGSIGTYAIQLAKYQKSHVTGVCSTSNTGLIKSLGADSVLDYTKEDISNTHGRYEVIFDTVGRFPKSKAQKILAENGRYVSTHASPVEERLEYLNLLKELAEKDIIQVVIDREFPLENIREAHAYVETGRKKGNVVITMES